MSEMGSFLGHLLSSVYFLLLGCWGAGHCSHSYHRARCGRYTQSPSSGARRSRAPYRSRAAHQGSTRLPLLSGLKVAAFSVQVALGTPGPPSPSSWWGSW
jgi:hypothetical protein